MGGRSRENGSTPDFALRRGGCRAWVPDEPKSRFPHLVWDLGQPLDFTSPQFLLL